ncbi:acidic leucine-rich nuclear phosphoprotein 32 family member E-like [Periophthalmus magnuspinnatus]|uniref:acidic leucine-rich nuclear phosphoprotein 32 family member E-like n=1 Tax=Periophthalmus magnuspinnatus TaxID=409849 RepID=UPI00145B4FE8|nr:acidic leucine-rich nuclear phosphoprotein 32 family member E-like [Periophthalmus magnuspinnatus]
MEMKKRITEELGGRKPAEVVELLLDSCLSADGELDGLSDDFSALEVLSLCNTGLKSLSKMPSLPKLKRLELSDNALSSGLEVLAEKCPALTYLNLSGNSIKDLSTIKGLQKLPALQSLDLEEDEEDEESWREKVFELLPQICFLNGFDQDHNQAPDDDDDDEAGPHDDDDDDDDDEDEDEDEGSEDEEVGLSYLMREGIQDEEDDGDYVEEEEEEEDGDEDALRGEKRKRDAEDDDDDDE